MLPNQSPTNLPTYLPTYLLPTYLPTYRLVCTNQPTYQPTGWCSPTNHPVPPPFMQVVLLGSGMDTRPWRLDLPAGVHWFEVDQQDVLR